VKRLKAEIEAVGAICSLIDVHLTSDELENADGDLFCGLGGYTMPERRQVEAAMNRELKRLRARLVKLQLRSK